MIITCETAKIDLKTNFGLMTDLWNWPQDFPNILHRCIALVKILKVLSESLNKFHIQCHSTYLLNYFVDFLIISYIDLLSTRQKTLSHFNDRIDHDVHYLECIFHHNISAPDSNKPISPMCQFWGYMLDVFVPLVNISFIRKRYHSRWRPMLGALLVNKHGRFFIVCHIC